MKYILLFTSLLLSGCAVSLSAPFPEYFDSEPKKVPVVERSLNQPIVAQPVEKEKKEENTGVQVYSIDINR